MAALLVLQPAATWDQHVATSLLPPLLLPPQPPAPRCAGAAVEAVPGAVRRAAGGGTVLAGGVADWDMQAGREATGTDNAWPGAVPEPSLRCRMACKLLFGLRGR